MPGRSIRLAAQLAPVLLFCASPELALAYQPGDLPTGIISGTIISTHYNGVANDLLTAGLGQTVIGSPVPPAVSSPPTAEELRRLAIYNNYRALIDPTTKGGYGLLYGPAS